MYGIGKEVKRRDKKGKDGGEKIGGKEENRSM